MTIYAGCANDAVDDEMVSQPRRWNIAELRSFMLVLGLISTAFDLITFGILLFLFHAPAELFRTGWFVESLLTQLLIMLIVRTQRPLWRSRPGTLLLYSTLAVAGVALAIPYMPGAHLLGFTRPPWPLMAVIVAISLAYTAASELGKHFVAAGAPPSAATVKRSKTR